MAISDKFATRDEVKRLNDFMALVVVVLFVGFAGVFVAATSMLVDSFNNKQATYEQLREQVQSNNDKLDLLIYQREHTN